MRGKKPVFFNLAVTTAAPVFMYMYIMYVLPTLLLSLPATSTTRSLANTVSDLHQQKEQSSTNPPKKRKQHADQVTPVLVEPNKFSRMEPSQAKRRGKGKMRLIIR